MDKGSSPQDPGRNVENSKASVGNYGTTRKTQKNDYNHLTKYDYRFHGSHVEPK